jgi:hypothetical protein
MKDALGHGSNARRVSPNLSDAYGPNSPARRGQATGYLADPQRKYTVNTTAARTAEGGELSTAARERIAGRQMVDTPPSTITDRMAAMALGQGHPKSNEVPLGSSFQAAKDALNRGRSVAMPRGAEGRRKS